MATFRCIYCRETKDANSFKKADHVIPQSFGKFNPNNPTLNQLVCDDCNQVFGDTIESILAIDSLEGAARFQVGLKPASEMRHRGPKSQTRRKFEDGPLPGAYHFVEYDPAQGLPVPRLLTQIGVKLAGSEERVYFLQGELPLFSELNEDYDLKDSRAFTLFGELQELMPEMEAKGWKFSKTGEIEGHHDAENVTAKVEFVIDNDRLRAIAKIAFNYLAFVVTESGHGEFMFRSELDAARNYIRYGKSPGYKIVVPINQAILENEKGAAYRSVGHVLVLEKPQDERSILAQVSLINSISYLVSLGRDFPDSLPFEATGLFFHVGDMSIIPVDAFSVRVSSLGGEL